MDIWGRISSAAKPPPPGHPLFVLTKLAQSLNILLYRATGGRVGGRFDDAPVLLLHHIGRKSGEERIAPLVYARDGEKLYLAASYGGQTKSPAWFFNVRDNPEVEVEIGRERRPVRARVLEGEERADGWSRLVGVWPSYETYQGRTERTIPVVELTPR